MTFRYISRYSNNKEVSPAQYITEIICEKKAKIDKLDLHYKFWISKKWGAFFRNQIATANKLLKTYPAKAIINALLSTEAQKIFSLRAPHLIAIIEKEEAKLKTVVENFTKEIDRKENTSFGRSNSSKSNILSKLREIDNES